MSDFNENEHPRDPKGQFASKGPAAEAAGVQLAHSTPSYDPKKVQRQMLGEQQTRMHESLAQMKTAVAQMDVRMMGDRLADDHPAESRVNFSYDADPDAAGAVWRATSVTGPDGSRTQVAGSLPAEASDLDIAEVDDDGEMSMTVGDMAACRADDPSHVPTWEDMPNASNAERAAARAEHALYRSGWVDAGAERDAGLSDALADLRHYAAVNKVDFDDAVDVSGGYYEADIENDELAWRDY